MSSSKILLLRPLACPIADRNLRVLDTLRTVAAQIVGVAAPRGNRPLAQVGLAWVSAQPGMTAPILGISKLEQLHDNLSSLEIYLTPEQIQTLDKSSAIEPGFPYSIFTQEINRSIFGGTIVRGW